jgi:peptidoglycan/xylan/chitin deacetylase (PgdA/CDA1 family)
VGGHSWSHARADAVDDAQLVDESERTAGLIAELTGRSATFVRPPYRKIDGPRYAALLGGRGFTTVTWSLDPRDWEATDPVEVARAVLDDLHCGAIVVLHDGGRDRSVTVDAVPLIVHGARLAGYRFVAL